MERVGGFFYHLSRSTMCVANRRVCDKKKRSESLGRKLVRPNVSLMSGERVERRNTVARFSFHANCVCCIQLSISRLCACVFLIYKKSHPTSLYSVCCSAKIKFGQSDLRYLLGLIRPIPTQSDFLKQSFFAWIDHIGKSSMACVPVRQPPSQHAHREAVMIKNSRNAQRMTRRVESLEQKGKRYR